MDFATPVSQNLVLGIFPEPILFRKGLKTLDNNKNNKTPFCDAAIAKSTVMKRALQHRLWVVLRYLSPEPG